MNDLLAQLAAALLLAGGGIGLGLANLLGKPGKRPTLVGPALGLGGLAVVLACTAAPRPVWLALGLVAALWLGSRILRSPLVAAACAVALAALRRPRVQGAVLLALAPLLGLAWVGTLPTALPDDPPEDPRATKLAHVVTVRPVKGLEFYTDRGRRVPAYEPSPGELAGADLHDLEALMLRRGEMGARVIRVAGPDAMANCHGWTFTGGRCWIRTDEAEAILHDNGYRAVSAPRAGDVVAYRQEDGTLAHSGVVTAVLENGTVLVESKWGWAGRYVHPVEAQQYAERWEFLHSDREGHWLCGTPAATGKTTVAE
jgi:hypothetical protein